MAQKTTATETHSREELAAYFEELASEFRRESEAIDVAVGNKTVSLTPPETVTASVAVVERSPAFRGNRETVSIELDWKP